MTAALLLAAAAAHGPQPAPSNAIVATVTGTILAGTDAIGLFGPVDGDLAGLPYTALYTYDLTVGRRSTRPFDDALDGGSRLGLLPAVTASVEVSGVVATVQGIYVSGVRTAVSTMSAGANDRFDDALHSVEHEITSNGSADLPARLDQSLTVALTNVAGQLYFAVYDKALRQFTSVTQGEFGPDAIYDVVVPGEGKLVRGLATQ